MSAAPQALVAAAAAMAGIWTLSWLIGHAPVAETAPGTATTTLGMPNWSRRGFLIRTGSVAAASVVAGVAGGGAARGVSATPTAGLPRPSRRPPSRPSCRLGPELAIDGITPIVVPNDRFYRIDTALIAPSVDIASWALTISGLVDRPTTLSYADLAELPIVEQYVTIACVSNEVGGNLVGNAKWTGVRLREVLDIAGVQSAATQLVGRSVDGWTAACRPSGSWTPLASR